jgi:hypothetical protein
MTPNDGCSRRRRVVLVLATIWLSGCATHISDGGLWACPLVIGYSREFHAQAAKELALLPEGSAIVAIMNDFAVIRSEVGGDRAAPRH